MIKANLADPAAYVAADPAARLREHRAVLLADASAARTSRGSAGELREAIGNARRHDLDARHVRQSARGRARSTGRRSRAGRAASTTPIFSAPTLRRRLHRPRPRQAADRQPAALQARSGASSPSAPPTRACRIAFENCAMDGNWATGDWNIAHNPDAWELMFNETARRQYRARMGALPPARLSDRPAAADPQMGAQDSSTSTARTRRCAGT